MSVFFVDPLLLPIVPPMDRNADDPDRELISTFPMELRTNRGVGLFGTRRQSSASDPRLIRMHEGVDLLAPQGTPVFAASVGTVIGATEKSLLLLHDAGFKYLTFYTHLEKVIVAIGAGVVAGQHLADVGNFFEGGENHLHFEIRYPFDSANPSYHYSLPVDPTMVLFNWEEKTFQNNSGHIIDNVKIKSIEEVRRGRLLRFFLVNVKDHSRDLFIPLQDMTPYNREMIDSLKSAFFSGKKVRIVWRESLFFKNIQTVHQRASLIAEVKVPDDSWF
jgi:hypothetical protein